MSDASFQNSASLKRSGMVLLGAARVGARAAAGGGAAGAGAAAAGAGAGAGAVVTVEPCEPQPSATAAIAIVTTERCHQTIDCFIEKPREWCDARLANAEISRRLDPADRQCVLSATDPSELNVGRRARQTK